MTIGQISLAVTGDLDESQFGKEVGERLAGMNVRELEERS